MSQRFQQEQVPDGTEEEDSKWCKKNISVNLYIRVLIRSYHSLAEGIFYYMYRCM